MINLKIYTPNKNIRNVKKRRVKLREMRVGIRTDDSFPLITGTLIS